MTDIVERLLQVQGDNDAARAAAAENRRLHYQLATAISINSRLVDEVERLRAEIEKWQECCDKLNEQIT